MQTIKKQHFVPQGSLRRFSADAEHLFVYDKLQDQIFPSNVRDIAQQRYFYDIPEEVIPQGSTRDDVDRQLLERALAKHDDQFPEIVQRIIDQLTTNPGFLNQVFRVLGIRRSPRISERQKSAMSFFIGLQYLRTKEFRTIIRHSMEEFVTQLRDFISPEQLDAAFDGFRGLGEANVRMHHLQMLSDPKFLQTMSDSLHKHIWVLGLNETKHLLYSSDNPVVRRPHRQHPVLSHTGVASPGIEVAMPLGSNHILILMERAHFAALTKFDSKVVPLRAEQVEYYNSLQVRGCDRQIYCAEDDFDLARDMCRRLPDLCHPERRRVASN